MRKKISLLLVFSLLVSMLFGNIYTANAALIPIAVMIEEEGFSSSNTTGDSGNTLLWSKGTTDIDSGTIRFTSAARQAGAVVKRNQVKLTDGFSTYFKLYFSGAADGIAFLLYKADEPKLGDYGGALGYADADADDGVDKAIGDSIVVEFDTWNNYEGLDGQSWQSNWNNHVGIMFEGNAKHSTQSDSGNAVSLSAGLQGNYIHAWVDYDGSTITVTYGTSATRSEGTTITRTVQAGDNVPLAGDDVYIGFTSSTGDNVTTHKLLKWYFMDTYVSGGLSNTAGSYAQAASTINVIPNKSVNPATVDITVKDNAGNTITDQNISIYIDGTIDPGSFNTSTGTYSYNVPSSLTAGAHTVRAVAEGGASNFANFEIQEYSISLNAPTVTSEHTSLSH